MKRPIDRPAQTRVTIVDVAREAEVSPKTVSRVIRGDDYVSKETLERVQEVIGRLGYRPNRAARSLVSRRTGVIGVVIPNVNNPFFSEVVRGIEDAAIERDYNMLLFSTSAHPERERAAYRYLEENTVDGIIVDLPVLPDDELSVLLRRQKVAVLIDHHPLEAAAGVVRIDFYDAAVEAVNCLVRAGRRCLAYLSPERNQYTFTERMRGVAETAARHNIPIPPDRYGFAAANFADSSSAATLLFAQNPDIDGLICFNDVMAIGALEACDHLGIAVPGKVAIVGFDDIQLAHLGRISLTTLRVPAMDIGTQATRLLLSRIDGLDGPSEVVIKPELIRRRTTPDDQSANHRQAGSGRQ